MVDNAYGSPFPQVAPSPSPVLDDSTLHLFTVSKAGLPGVRLGFAVGPRRFVDPIVGFLSNAALHAPALPQDVLAEMLASGRLDQLVADHIRPHYRDRWVTFQRMVAAHLGPVVEHEIHDGGGMFAWIRFPGGDIDDIQLYERLKTRGLFTVPGRFFFTPDPAGPAHRKQCLRLSIGSAEDTTLDRALDLLAKVVQDLRDRRRSPLAGRAG